MTHFCAWTEYGQRFAPAPNLAGLETVSPPATDGWLRLSPDNRLPAIEGRETPSAEQTHTIVLDLVHERSTDKPGETARLMIQSPWQRATALLTVEREGIRSRSTFTLTSTQQTVSVPIAAGDIPNLFVSVLLIKGRSKTDVLEGDSASRMRRSASRSASTRTATSSGLRHLSHRSHAPLRVSDDRSACVGGRRAARRMACRRCADRQRQIANCRLIADCSIGGWRPRTPLRAPI